ncbi:tumor necrosis factor alpha-induced protein 3-like [Megalops cyprinoides]|uniref:tumor necrosis factor alpha-induced protein 3-like n=1 Tax=Megalops cyprinoides TaxID=118141 RepID=UPI001863FD6F|nr:tumor necrosis factor alpha-induced protein 3-like [Megalops cyprinoides]
MLGKPSFKGFCERCYLANHKGSLDSQTPEPKSGGQRSSQLSDGHHRLTAKQLLPSERKEKTTAHVEERRSPIRSLGSAQASAELDRPRPCRRKGCTNYGNSRCQGLCNSCYKSHSC